MCTDCGQLATAVHTTVEKAVEFADGPSDSRRYAQRDRVREGPLRQQAEMPSDLRPLVWRRLNDVAFAVAVVVQCADMLSFYFLTSRFGIALETNPIAIWLYQYHLAYVSKAALIAVLFWFWRVRQPIPAVVAIIAGLIGTMNNLAYFGINLDFLYHLFVDFFYPDARNQ
jgi:hypothetical protein